MIALVSFRLVAATLVVWLALVSIVAYVFSQSERISWGVWLGFYGFSVTIGFVAVLLHAWLTIRTIILQIGASRPTIFPLVGEVKVEMAERLIRLFCKANGQPVIIVIDSPGGDVASAKRMIAEIQRYDGEVKIFVRRRCHSAAFLIACAVVRGNRFALKRGTSFVIHGVKEKKPEPAPAAVRVEAAQVATMLYGDNGVFCTDRLNSWVATLLSEATGLDKQHLFWIMQTGGDLVFSAKAALKNGLIGRIVD